MQMQELVPLGPKTTMKIGGQARYFAELQTKDDVEKAVQFAEEKRIPLIVLGAGSNTIFADSVIEALVVRIKAEQVHIENAAENGRSRVVVESGMYLASLIVELAKKGLDLSPMTGIPGTLGGAIFGNAGQGAGGIWIDHYVKNIEAFIDGQWKTFKKEDCDFRYRESFFKDYSSRLQATDYKLPAIVWSVTLDVPSGDPVAIDTEINRLLKKRIETQPHIKTAGSCFKSLPDGTPAWKLIDAAGLRGFKVGNVEVAEKHANFLLNTGGGTFNDVVAVTEMIKEKVPQIASIEMRLYGEDGHIIAG